MRKFLSLVTVLFLFCFTGVAQDYVIPLASGKTKAEVINNSSNNLRMVFNLASIYGNNVVAKNGMDFTEFYFSKGYSSGEIGSPKIPVFKELIQVPFGAEIKVNLKGYSQEEFKLESLGITNSFFPVQPSLRKDQDINEVKFEYNEDAYKKHVFNGSPMAKVEILGTMRGVRIARIEVSPIDYNATEGKIVVYNDIEVEVEFIGANKAKEESIRKATASPYFTPIYNRLANSFTKDVFDTHPDLTNYPVHMLIVSHRMFEATLQPFVEWKTKKGFNVEVAYTDVIGTTTAAIKTFIYNKYNNATPESPAPSFIIFVGDVEQVPSSGVGSESAKQTDLYYGSVDGDYFPEMYYGRFSATNTTQLSNIINKILYYEQYQFADPTYLNKTTLIAGVDGTWNPNVGQPTIKYGTKYYFNATQGYTTVNEYGVASDPNNPGANAGYTGCYDADRIKVGFINYTAHCNETSWGDPSLTVSGVNALTNANMYPLAIGNCCLAADFGYGESAGEAWLRGANKGAVTYIGSSPSSYWFEDFYWSVGAFPITGNNNGYVPTFEETTLGAYDAQAHSDYVTAGALVFTGNLAVTEVDLAGYPSHSSPTYYWQAYNVLGDPSLVPYFTEGETNTVSHMAIVPIGLNTYTVTALPGSYVAISKDGVLHGAALVDASGEVEVSIDPILDGGNVDIVVTRPQTIPYMVQVPAAALEGPYIVMHQFTVSDPTGNNNGSVEYGEAFTIGVTLKNVGADEGTTISAVITGTDTYFTVTDGDAVGFGTIPAGETGNMITIENAFAFTVANNVPDQYQATFVIEITDGTDTWTSNLKITANAPVLSIGNLTIDDAGQGTPNYLEPGESASVVLTLSNTGNAAIDDVDVELLAESLFLTITDGNETASVAANATTEVTFTVAANESTPSGLAVELSYTAEKGIFSASGSQTINIGALPEVVIGDGTQDPSTYYPLDNYYKANRTQMLYLTSEVSQAPQVITHLALDIKSIGTVPVYNNLTIKLMETETAVVPGSFITTTTATTVFTAATYTMPTATGWLTFDITDFAYSGTANLLVEVAFGVNDAWTSSRFKVNCSTTPAVSVAYGYDDTDAIPTYDGNSSVRPNLFLTFQTEEVQSYSVSFTVKDNSEASIEGAEITIGSMMFATNSEGLAQVNLVPGSYSYTVTHEGFNIHEGSFEVIAENIDLLLNMTPTGVNAGVLENVSLFPNPFTSNISITSASTVKTVVVTSILGQEVMRIANSGNDNIEVSTSLLPTGVYLVTLIGNANDTRVTKMIKK